MDKALFNLVLNLIRKQPWLSSKVRELESILYDECSDLESRNLLIEILDRFLYVDRELYFQLIMEVAQDIVTEPGGDEAITQVVAMAADSNADSSQEVLYNLKPKLEELGWRRHVLVDRYGKALSKCKDDGYRKIILVDDFVGSGKTVVNRVRDINLRFSQAKIEEFSVKVKVLVSTAVGLDNVLSAGVDITAQEILKKGIDDYYDAERAALNRDLMLKLEAGLSAEYEGRDMPSLGYGGAQAAYCRAESNTPNSVFPIFWWPVSSNGSERSRILVRAMRDA